MKSFERWTRDIQANLKADTLVEEEKLPFGLYGDKESGFYFYCRSCEEYTKAEIDDPKEFNMEGAYCGRSQFCLP